MADHIGERFGRLQVLAPAADRKILCVCDCGTLKEFTASNVVSGKSKSCGCFNREATSARARKHGWAGTRTHKTWMSMNNRCYCKGDVKAYAKYGARGIGVCDRWRHSFENFLADMGEKPEGMTLGRIDNNAGYSPENCRWETITQQARNKRNTRMTAAVATAIRIAVACGVRRKDIAADLRIRLGMVHDIVAGRAWT